MPAQSLFLLIASLAALRVFFPQPLERLAPTAPAIFTAYAHTATADRRHLSPEDDHIAARRAGELVAALNATGADERREFIASAWNLDATGETVDAVLQRLADLSERLGRRLSLVTVELSAPEGTLAHVVDAQGMESAIILDIDSRAPYRVVVAGTIRHIEAVGPEKVRPKSVDLATPIVTVPLKFRNSRPFVEAMLEGAGPFQFMVETGCDCIVLTPETIAAMDGRLQPLDPQPASANPEVRVGTVYNVREVQIGAASLRDMAAYVGHKEDGVDGVLGLAAFRDLLLTIDYPGGHLELRRGSLPEPDGREVLQARRHGDFFVVDVRVGRASMPAVVDTQAAAGAGLSLTPEIAARTTFTSVPVPIGTAVVGHRYETAVKLGRITGDMKVGRYTFKQPFVSVMSFPGGLPQLPNLGADVLSHFEVTLDQQNARLRLSLPARSSPARDGKQGTAVFDMPPPYRALGMVTVAQDGELRIVRVQPGGPADRAGLRDGDVIVRFDGTPAASLPRSLNTVATSSAPVMIEVTRNGRTVKTLLDSQVLVR